MNKICQWFQSSYGQIIDFKLGFGIYEPTYTHTHTNTHVNIFWRSNILHIYTFPFFLILFFHWIIALLIHKSADIKIAFQNNSLFNNYVDSLKRTSQRLVSEFSQDNIASNSFNAIIGLSLPSVLRAYLKATLDERYYWVVLMKTSCE